MTYRMTRAGHRAGCVLAVALVLSPSSSAAQQAEPGQLPTQLPQRPAGAVFTGFRQPQRDILSLTTETYGGYDQELQGGPSAPGGFGLVRTGAFAGLDAGLAYAPTQSTTFDFNARGFTSLRLYTNPSEFVPANSNGDVSASYRLTRRATLQGRGGFMYTPYFDFPIVEELPLPGVIAPVPIRQRDTTVSPRRVGTYDGGADLSYGLTDVFDLGVSYGIRRTDLIEDELSPLEETQHAIDTTASARVGMRFNRQTISRIVFVHREGQYDTGLVLRPVRINDVQFTVDRDWARTPTRRTALSFMIGPSRVEQEGNESTRASAGVAITHTFARSWDFRASYRRGITFLDGSPAPIPSNGYTVNLGGLVTRRLEISLGAAAILGEIGLEASGSAYDTYSGSARVRYGLRPRLALHGEYVYQSLSYSDPRPELPPGQDRAGVRGGVTWYLPLVQESSRRERPGTRRGQESR